MTKQETEIRAAHKGLYAALAAAQAEMGRAMKDTNNPHFKSKYADLASVCDACMPALSRHGIAVLQPPYDDETGRYVKTIFVHGDSGETAECRVPLIIQKNDMQGYGSAATYARRYGLMGMAGIAPEDDDGNAAAKAAPVTELKEPRRTNGYAEARDYLLAAKTLADLQSAWSNLPADVKANATVIAAKDARKAEIQKPADDLAGDQIPY
jgi:cytochrome c1